MKLKKCIDQKTKDDIKFSYDKSEKICRSTIKKLWTNFEVELSEGLYAGQKINSCKYSWMLCIQLVDMHILLQL